MFGTCPGFQLKKRLTSAEPRLVVERTVVRRPEDVLTASSMGLRDGDLHLFDRHDPVVDADDHAEAGLGKDGDGYLIGT